MTKDKAIIQMFNALQRIKSYSSPKELKKHSEEDYGLEYEEALEMSYENALEEAKIGLKGITIKNIDKLK